MTIPNWDNSALKNGLFLLTDEELEEVLKQQKEKSDCCWAITARLGRKAGKCTTERKKGREVH